MGKVETYDDDPGIEPSEASPSKKEYIVEDTYAEVEETVARSNHIWSSEYSFEFNLFAYAIQQFIDDDSSDKIIIPATYRDFSIGYKKKHQILIKGSIVFIYKNILYSYSVDFEEDKNYIFSNGSVSEIVKKIEKYMETKNPWKGQYFEVFPSRQDIGFAFKPKPILKLEQVILDDKMKEDIHDNTIFHLLNLEGMNGVLLFGVPGTGKSAICAAISNAALKEKITVLFLTNRVSYSILEDFISKYAAPCLMIMEDVDSLGQDRTHGPNPGLSEFLQFMNGLSVKDHSIVVMANTNHIDHLDSALNNRPMRFNRLIEFNLPTTDQMDRLLDLYFKEVKLTSEMKKLCYNKKFTGAHIAEIKRTCSMLSKKRKQTIETVFEESVNIIIDNFSIDLKKNTVGIRDDN
jgi:SpoVK/Ycf46/Vps4 family AAA+-type ATPase